MLLSNHLARAKRAQNFVIIVFSPPTPNEQFINVLRNVICKRCQLSYGNFVFPSADVLHFVCMSATSSASDRIAFPVCDLLVGVN